MAILNKKMKNSATIKFAAVALLTLLLLIPLGMIQSLVQEREGRRDDAIKEVSSKWGGEQVLIGPVLSIPYKTYITSEVDGRSATAEKVNYAHILPETLNIEGIVLPEMRQRGIYDIAVYNSNLNISGEFLNPNFAQLSIPEKDIIWNDIIISMGIPDMKGIKDKIALAWDGAEYTLQPGVATGDVIASGVSAKIPLGSINAKEKHVFSFQLMLNGSKALQFAPLGAQTSASLASPWPNPSFNGAFLPDAREVNENGFSAQWKTLHLNRNYPQYWHGQATKEIADSAFGVELLIPVDEYQKTTRSVKYGIMLISLTFLIFFLVEMFNRKHIHPIQYILVGLALCIFYLLLLSLSEYINFNYAYLAASIATILLIAGYVKTVFKNNKLALMQSLILIIIYGFIYILLQLEDYALLMGSIGLFIVLAAVMYISRNIDWYGFNSDEK
ncbi:cell envelope integrity protein CreD [Candidatus Falkowbacteria bacterium CG10_big_fil_rev_8_21_14_0_10_44_15]|uniref:Cell envelope integrity protein CreD n=1 Tax=Candidatus Falkowbacteria bacterium CG10_big_fil_rev_8_21_14_0_10_44_15 TaxID=1974569 RepID=A0A2H0UZM0_9BACT|nr:MAG: cell envelope integrity protein CreD [Candidatus Falkowbacteria bacterium CG10_big_fil_rev_8_21_14_0_10_44_15]